MSALGSPHTPPAWRDGPGPTSRPTGGSSCHRPIVDLNSGSVVAVEVIAAPPPRGPGTSVEAAVQEGSAMVEWLVALVREAALAESLLPLVLPLPARALMWEGLASLAETRLRREGRRPRDVVFMLGPELSELAAPMVVAGTSRLRSAGFRCGFGTAMVRPDLVVRAAPFLMRIDEEVVSGIARDQRHATVVEGLSRIGRGSGVYALAAGVGSVEDVVRLRRCGVRVGTGPFFADRTWSPGERVTPVPEPTAGQGGDDDAGPRVTEFMVPPVGLDSDATSEQVLESFTGNPVLNSVVLIDRRERPVGALDRTRFLLSVTGRYGHALHAKRPASRLAEPPRTVPAWMSALAALRVAGQDTERVYDDLIVTNAYGQCLGVVHVGDLIRSLSRG